MKFKILSALIAAPVIVVSGAALAHTSEELPAIDTISISPTKCIVYIADADGNIQGVQGTDGRVFVKFDVKRPPLTVDANCTVTEFYDQFQSDPLAEEDFDCFVQINKFGHWHQFLYASDPEVRNQKRFRNGKAKLSCSGPYVHDQNPEYDPPGE